jgi:hypothetical protein
VVPSLYGAVVSDSDAQQAGQDAMRQVLVLDYQYQAGR